MLFLVRHGRPLVDPGVEASAWALDPAGFDDVWALRDRLPHRAAWYSSPEPKALMTAQILVDHDVGVVEDLREHQRTSGWFTDVEGVMRRAFASPGEPAVDGWEPIAACRRRVLAAVTPILSAHAGEDVVLVGHGTAWTLLVAELTGREPDLERWSRLGLPDVMEVAGTAE